MAAPLLRAPSMSSARRLVIRDNANRTHHFVYCGEDCIAYRGPGPGGIRRTATAEVWRLALHEFDCMDWAVVSADEFDKLLPTLRITT